MTDTQRPDLDAIRSRLKAVTPGEWEADDEYVYLPNHDECLAIARGIDNPNDAQFIARAPSDIAALLDHADAQQATEQRAHIALDGTGLSDPHKPLAERVEEISQNHLQALTIIANQANELGAQQARIDALEAALGRLSDPEQPIVDPTPLTHIDTLVIVEREVRRIARQALREYDTNTRIDALKAALSKANRIAANLVCDFEALAGPERKFSIGGNLLPEMYNEAERISTLLRDVLETLKGDLA